ncbi:ClpXP protease specificity-enhancing factor [Teredinibacter haidensis]|uniref:ClpXP protease specificity-enhancing factor n=1 Tax=Teredinibacter haidensis TaxID=2731755 RepID=UPI000949045E|nr:ClpXP protease specificity-enhancing factor [Teredinibacter haidensis]
MAMTSSRPYLIRALYEWIVDNDFTPHIVVNALAGDVEVPQKYVNKEGQIVLNIAPRAVSSLEIANKAVVFNARFGGIPTDIYVPCHAVLGIYARENGQGMMFESETPPEPEPTSPDSGDSSDTPRRPSLRVVK